MSDIIDLDAERSARTSCESSEQPAVHDEDMRVGPHSEGRPQRHPMVIFFELMSRHGVVQLPNGFVYRIIDNYLYVQEDGRWHRSGANINDLIDIIQNLTRQQWQEILNRCKQ